MGIIDEMEKRAKQYVPLGNGERIGLGRDYYVNEKDHRRLTGIARLAADFGAAHALAHEDLTDESIALRRDALAKLTRIGNALAANDIVALDAALDAALAGAP